MIKCFVPSFTGSKPFCYTFLRSVQRTAYGLLQKEVVGPLRLRLLIYKVSVEEEEEKVGIIYIGSNALEMTMKPAGISISLGARSQRGIIWYSFRTEHHESMDFVDDTIAMSIRDSDMQIKIDDVNVALKQESLMFNVGNTKAMAIKSVLPADFLVDDQHVKSFSNK